MLDPQIQIVHILCEKSLESRMSLTISEIVGQIWLT